jgi:hypothetical protein
MFSLWWLWRWLQRHCGLYTGRSVRRFWGEWFIKMAMCLYIHISLWDYILVSITAHYIAYVGDLTEHYYNGNIDASIWDHYNGYMRLSIKATCNGTIGLCIRAHFNGYIGESIPHHFTGSMVLHFTSSWFLYSDLHSSPLNWYIGLFIPDRWLCGALHNPL